MPVVMLFRYFEKKQRAADEKAMAEQAAADRAALIDAIATAVIARLPKPEKQEPVDMQPIVEA